MTAALGIPWLRNDIRDILAQNEIGCVLSAPTIDALYHTFNHVRHSSSERHEIHRVFRARLIKKTDMSKIPSESYRQALASKHFFYVRFS